MKKFLLKTIILISLFFPLWALSQGISTASSGWNIQDTLSLKYIESTAVSSNGKMIAYVVSHMVFSQDKKTAGRWISELVLQKNNQPVQMMLSPHQKIASPAFSPDGLYLAYLDEGNQFQSLWILNIQTGQYYKLIELNTDVITFSWSPNSKKIALVAKDLNRVSGLLRGNQLVDQATKAVNARVYVLPFASQTLSAKIVKAITPANVSISMDSDYTWAPDGQSIAYAYQSKPGDERPMKTQLAQVNLKSCKTRFFDITKKYAAFHPMFSPNGKWIAVGMALPPKKIAKQFSGDANYNIRTCLLNTQNNRMRCLALVPNENSVPVAWNEAGTGMFVWDVDGIYGPQIYFLSINKNKPVKNISHLSGFIDNNTFKISPNGQYLSFSYESVFRPAEVFVLNTKNFKIIKRTHLQSPSQKLLGHVQVIHWRAPDHSRLEGLLFTPPHYDAHKTYPLLVAVHGGPTENWSLRYLGGTIHRWKINAPFCVADFLSRGFIVFEPNPRGSGGYGRDFRLALFGRLGEIDYQDILSGVHRLIQEKIADPNHLALWGWSYGGYLVSWMMTQTHIFKYAVEGSGYTDVVSYVGTTDIPEQLTGFLGKTLWSDPQLYLKRSPIMYTKNIKTPLLIFGGEKDTRIPLSQGIELYTALKEQHKPVRLFVMQGQGHLPVEPDIILASMQQTENWLSRAL